MASAGAAYVSERNAGGTNACGQVAKLTASDKAADDYFGWAVSVAGDVALVGAIFADPDGANDAGAAYVIVGTATAVPAGSGSAYGVPVIRATANLKAKIVRASDGKVLAVKEAEANEGGQALRGAGQAALKKANDEARAKLAAQAGRPPANRPALGNVASPRGAA